MSLDLAAISHGRRGGSFKSCSCAHAAAAAWIVNLGKNVQGKGFQAFQDTIQPTLSRRQAAT